MLNRKKRRIPEGAPFTDEEFDVVCSGCKSVHKRSELLKTGYICPDCGRYVRVPARDRIRMIADSGSFYELDRGITSVDFLDFPGYGEKLEKAKKQTGERSAVVTGVMRVLGIPCAVFAMDSRFVMASMGSAVGEKITRLFEYAEEMRLPVFGVTCSGGARMQEGAVSLMQMAKCSGAVRRHSDAGLLYVALLTDPTTGGMTASIAMEGDITLAEPHALVGFAGRRVVEQTTGTALPDDFQTSEFLLDHGFVDAVVVRSDLRDTLGRILRLHVGGGD